MSPFYHHTPHSTPTRKPHRDRDSSAGTSLPAVRRHSSLSSTHHTPHDYPLCTPHPTHRWNTLSHACHTLLHRLLRVHTHFPPTHSTLFPPSREQQQTLRTPSSPSISIAAVQLQPLLAVGDPKHFDHRPHLVRQLMYRKRHRRTLHPSANNPPALQNTASFRHHLFGRGNPELLSPRSKHRSRQLFFSPHEMNGMASSGQEIIRHGKVRQRSVLQNSERGDTHGAGVAVKVGVDGPAIQPA